MVKSNKKIITKIMRIREKSNFVKLYLIRKNERIYGRSSSEKEIIW